MESLPEFSPDVVRCLIVQVPFFNAFSEEEKTLVLSHMHTFLRFMPEEKIISQGDYHDASMYILLSGRALITTKNDDGKSIVLDDVVAGDIFGEITFITNTPRTANVVAEEASIVWRIDQALLDNIPNQLREKIKDTIIEKLARLVVHANKKIKRLYV